MIVIPRSDWRDVFRSDCAGKYWSWARLCVDLTKYPDQSQDLINSRIIRIVPEISVQSAGKNILEWLLESIRDGETGRLKKLNISNNCWALNNIDFRLLSSAVLKLQDCRIFGARPGQQRAIFAGIKNSPNTSLRHLDLGFKVLEVASDIVAEVAMKLEKLVALLSPLQLKAVLTRLADTEDSRLRRLRIGSHVNISSLDPEVVAGSLIKLQNVGQGLGLGISSVQATALFSRICGSPDLRHTKLYLQNKANKEVSVFVYGRMNGDVSAIVTKVKGMRLGERLIMIFSYWYGKTGISSSVPPSVIPSVSTSELNAKLSAKLWWIV